MKLVYCSRCVMPNTKPDLSFNEQGVCDACISAEKKDHNIDWAAREQEFIDLIARYKTNGKNYDCIIPVSGGKDSTYQAYMAKKYGLKALLVSFEQSHISPIGQHNIDNIARLGDLVYFKKNPDIYRKMVIEGFKRVGDNEWPNHIGIFTIPTMMAVKFNIPLLIWGENSQLEYGGPAASTEKNVLDRRWLEEFGGLLGNRVEDMIGVDGITRDDLLPYIYPDDKDIQRVGVTGLFLGYYFKWDARKQLSTAIDLGMKIKDDGPIEGTYTNYENLDETTVGLHDYLKYTKFGFGRATDHACLDIRNGRITREEGVRLVRMYDGKYPHYAVKHFSEYTGMSKEEIDSVIDKFTNKQIFEMDGDTFKKDMAGNLVLKSDYV